MPGSCSRDILLRDSCSVAYIQNESEISIWSLHLHHRIHPHSLTAWNGVAVDLESDEVLEMGLQRQAEVEN